MIRLILLRHGESEYNRQNRFTGIADVDLSEDGAREAAAAGRRMKEAGLHPRHVFTSSLKRSFNSAVLALNAAGLEDLIPGIIRHEGLRERDYGDLTGMLKDEAEKKFGREQVHLWRRSFAARPPGGKSLQDVFEQCVRPCFENDIKPHIDEGEDILIVAHGNSLRALLVALGAETPETIENVEMPGTGTPLVLEIEGGEIMRRYSLDGPVPG